jgi:Lon protease-like protein
VASRDIPLFPLHTVLFPGGNLRLKVFEARYMDMVSACMRDSRPFGVCLIKSGPEVGGGAEPEAVGTLAHIVGADMETAGILMLRVAGGERFVVEHTLTGADQLLTATVRAKGEEPALAVPEHCLSALEILTVIAERAPEAVTGPLRDDASWVGFRLAEILPLKTPARQAMLEMNDPVARLEILMAVLRKNQLI